MFENWHLLNGRCLFLATAGLGVGIWVLVDNDSISNMASVLEQDDTKVENLEGSSNVVKQGT